MESRRKQHIVLVHSACQGAWCWYKLKPLLEAASHRVTALDMAASSTNLRNLHELQSLADYAQPLLDLMASIPAGHSFGGFTISLAMDMYPHKISVAVFLAAFMPDCINPPSFTLDKVLIIKW